MKRVVALERAAFYVTESGAFSHFARAANATECCLLRLSPIGVVRQIEADVRMIWVRSGWRGFHGSSVRSRIADGQDCPAVKCLAGGIPCLASCHGKHCHFLARGKVHAVDGNPVISRAYQKCFRDGLWPVGSSGLPAREHASTEILRPTQGWYLVTQGSAARETLHPTPATAPSGTRQARPRNHRSATAGFPHVWTHNIPLRRDCSPGSTAQPSQREI